MSNGLSLPTPGPQNPRASWVGEQRHRPVPVPVSPENLTPADIQVSRYGTFIPPLGLPEDGRSKNRFFKSATPTGSYHGGTNFVNYTSPVQGSPYTVELRDHCHQQWIVVLLTILLFLGVSYQILIVQVPPAGPDCGSRFGSILGVSKRVTAYSNCRYSYRGEGVQNYVTTGLYRIYTGAKWGSIEYARRYWILRRFLVIPPVVSLDEIMNITEVKSVSNSISETAIPLEHFWNLDGPLPLVPSNSTPYGFPGESNETKQDPTIPLQSYQTVTNNGFPSVFPTKDAKAASPNQCRSYRGNSSLPKVGDLLVYAKDRSTLSHGHVAVIVNIKGPYSQPDPNNGSAVGVLSDGYVLKDEYQANKSDANGTSVNKAESAYRDNSTDLQSEYVYYKVYLAEQNWDNRPWIGTCEPMTGATRKYAPSAMANYGATGRVDGLAAQSTIKGLNDTVKPKEENIHGTEDKQNSSEESEPRNFSRILILREYHPSCALYLEDTLGQRILGWVRPMHLED